MTTETLSKFVLPSAAIPMCGQTNGQLPNCVYERKVLVPVEKEFPKFTENQNVKYITQGNVLYSYEILS